MNLLGQKTSYKSTYNPGVLCPIPRAAGRQRFPGFSEFYGEDRWHAYEISWLNVECKPEVAWGEFRFSADSPYLIESKSFKLYLNSFNQERLTSRAVLANRLQADLSLKAQSSVTVKLFGLEEKLASTPMTGFCLDQLAVTFPKDKKPLKSLDFLSDETEKVEETLYSHLFRSLCPVTGQPDWATIWFTYRGLKWDPATVLAYVVSYREHADFHEQCVEQLFHDLWHQAQPETLTVGAAYTRRGGLSITPVRSSVPAAVNVFHHWRQ